MCLRRRARTYSRETEYAGAKKKKSSRKKKKKKKKDDDDAETRVPLVNLE